MIITHHREKLINAIIYFATNTRYCGKTKLLKLLYFLDFKHFKQTGKSVTGLEYFAWERAPVPRELFAELSGNMEPDLKASINELPKEGFQQIIRHPSFIGLHLQFFNYLCVVGAASAAQHKPMCG